MDRDTVRGMADAYALIDALPGAAEKEMAEDLADIGQIILHAQEQAVPERTGALKSGLSVQLLLGQLKVRVGLIGRLSRAGRSNLGSLFYGVVVNFGRRAQVVTVQRRRVGASGLRNRRKRAQDIAATYALPVTALPAREFIAVGPTIDGEVDARLADFWARAFSRVPGGQG